MIKINVLWGGEEGAPEESDEWVDDPEERKYMYFAYLLNDAFKTGVYAVLTALVLIYALPRIPQAALIAGPTWVAIFAAAAIGVTDHLIGRVYTSPISRVSILLTMAFAKILLEVFTILRFTPPTTSFISSFVPDKWSEYPVEKLLDESFRNHQ